MKNIHQQFIKTNSTIWCACFLVWACCLLGSPIIKNCLKICYSSTEEHTRAALSLYLNSIILAILSLFLLYISIFIIHARRFWFIVISLFVFSISIFGCFLTRGMYEISTRPLPIIHNSEK